MERSDPQEVDPAGESATREALGQLRQASDAAQRLVAEAAAEAAATIAGGPRKPPPAGWQTPMGDSRPSAARAPEDGDLLARSIQALCELIGPELQDRLAQALREVLLALRALIDGYIERLERHPPAPHEVQDIPIL